jgi:phosphopantetheine adenylyltransferase|tara:strand:+ start:97 stop:369 length:273 start_codon:yes stop_codon:yes gene_type:complete
MEKKKLEKTDLDALMQIRQQYQDNNMQLGIVASDEYMVNQQLKQINDVKENCFKVLDDLRKQETDLVKSLEDKYGEGQINLEEGVFIPNS